MERLEWLQKLNIRKTERFQRHLELSQTTDKVQHSTESAFTPVRSQGKCCPRVLLDQDSQPLNPRDDPERFLPESRGDQPMQSEHHPISRQQCPSQRIRKQVQMDSQIAHRLQAEEQSLKQYQTFQTFKQVDRDCVNYSAQVPHRQKRQHPSVGQVRSNGYSGYNHTDRDIESNHIRRQTTRDR